MADHLFRLDQDRSQREGRAVARCGCGALAVGGSVAVRPGSGFDDIEVSGFAVVTTDGRIHDRVPPCPLR